MSELSGRRAVVTEEAPTREPEERERERDRFEVTDEELEVPSFLRD